jgi:glycosyltransferase involved in cell wall biosynthesis
MRKYSVIIPVYNRPEEIKELLESLTLQTYKAFEVLIIEDGSTLKCENIVSSYKERFL